VSDVPSFSLYRLDEPLSRDEVLAEFAVFPGRLVAVVQGARPDALERPPAPGHWSALQVLGHLRDAALVYALRFRFIALNAETFMPNMDEERWVAEGRETLADIPALLETIVASRADITRLLGRLDDATWAKTGRHEVLGDVALEEYVRHQVVHERGHLAQLRAALEL
jgi:hypothetical protein